MKLFLDNTDNPIDESVKVIRTYEDAISLVESNGIPLHISFNYYLGYDNYFNPLPGGLEFAKWLIFVDSKEIHKIPDGFEYIVHSDNLEEKNHIESILNNYIYFGIVLELQEVNI